MSLYHEAAEILTSPSSHGGSLKSRIFNQKSKHIKSPPGQLYALVLETAKWSPVLKEVVERAELLKHERKLSPALALLLSHDLLLVKGGIALPQTHGLRTSIEKHKGRLSSELTLARLRRKAPTLDVLRELVERDSAGQEKNYPRWVRINALKTTLEDELESTFKDFERARNVNEVVTKPGKHILIDHHVPNLVAITPGTDLSKTEAYISGHIILQDKASCFPAYLLDPRSEDGDIIDACAAPGNKTTHLAAISHQHRPEQHDGGGSTWPRTTIFAFEKDASRAKTLDKMVKIAGSKSTTRIGLGQDFLRVNPADEKYAKVGALLLDPSCSGSGIVGRDSMPEVHLPATAQVGATPGSGKHQAANKLKRKHGEAETAHEQVLVDDDGNETVVKSEKDLEARLEALSAFQLALLLHAFRFPAARKVTYSTCSVHAQENEHVVTRALSSAIAKERGWRVLERERQVAGMREWPVRGVASAAEEDAEVAEACIRSYKDDGHGVMGFFVAGFVRDGSHDATNAGEGPYLRDDEGKMIRDVMGMPVLRETGELVQLDGTSGDPGIPEVDGEKSESDDDSDDEDTDQSGDDDDEEEEEEEEEWNGFGD